MTDTFCTPWCEQIGSLNCGSTILRTSRLHYDCASSGIKNLISPLSRTVTFSSYRISTLVSSLLISAPRYEVNLTLLLRVSQYQKDKKHLTAFGNTRNGLFLVIPSSLASTYSPSTHSTYTSQLSPPSIRCAKTSSDEFEYARDLAKWSERFEVVRNHIESGPATSDGSGTSTVEEISKILVKGGYKRRELVEIKDLESDGFFDVQGQVKTHSLSPSLTSEPG